MNAATTAIAARSLSEPICTRSGYTVQTSDAAPGGCATDAAPVQAFAVAGRMHQFEAVAFVENFNLRELSQAIPGGRLRPHELRYPLEGAGEVFLYPFGAAVFHDARPEQRDRFLERIRATLPRLGRKVVAESFSVREEPGARTGFSEGSLHIGELGPARAAAVAIVVAQSAATEYYERLVEDLFRRTDALVDSLEKSGTVRARPSRLHRFIGEAVTSRKRARSSRPSTPRLVCGSNPRSSARAHAHTT